MKRYIIAAISILAFAASMVSCTDHEVIRQLDDVEAYLSEHPDSALSVLDSMSAESIRGREANAKFALLYSMALDKSYIDATNDSLINIAVDWYRKHGTADERLKSYYYQGRVYQNSGDNEAAMESFVRAEASESEDNMSNGLLYKAMSGIYIQIFDFVKAELYNNRAKECYLLAGDTDKYAGTILFSSDLHYAQEESSEAIACLDSVKILLDSISTSRRNAYYIRSMRIKRDLGDRSGLSDELNQYLSSTGAENISWLDVADYYTYLGQYDKSESALQRYREFHPEYKDEPAYHIAAYILNDSLGDYREALDDYINYSLLSDSLSLVIAEQDTGTLRERPADGEGKEYQIACNTDICVLHHTFSNHSIHPQIPAQAEQNGERVACCRNVQIQGKLFPSEAGTGRTFRDALVKPACRSPVHESPE